MSLTKMFWLPVLVGVLSLTHSANAWNNTGHEVVALLAYQALDGPTQKKVQEILQDHPDYESYLAKNLAASANRSERIAMNAGTWSDWIRTHHKSYHRGTWHYVNKPFIVVDADDIDTRNEIEAAFSDPKRNHGDILKIIPESLKIIKKEATTPKERSNRAVRLAWLFHLVGDIHQPLHAVALCNKQIPGGDRGGNSVWIIPKHHRVPSKLHAFWDHSLGNRDGDAAAGLARDIQMAIKVDADAQKVSNPDVWADESVKLAKSDVYAFKNKAIEFVINTDEHGPSAAPNLPDGYEENAEQIARQRVALAGARLAVLLTDALK